MRGKDFAAFVEKTLAEKGIKKGDFYNATGISATAMHGWKNGSMPKADTIAAVEEYLGVQFGSPVQIDEDTAELLESIRSRPDLGVLLRSARDVPPSSVYSLVAQLEREKENNA